MAEKNDGEKPRPVKESKPNTTTVRQKDRRSSSSGEQGRSKKVDKKK